MSKFQAGDIIMVPMLDLKAFVNKSFFRITAVDKKHQIYETTYITTKDQDQRSLVSNSSFAYLEKYFVKCPTIYCICFGIFVET